MRLLAAIFLLLLGAVPTRAQSPKIIWSPDLEWTNCYAEAAPFQVTRLYVFATGEDFTGAEFRATGLTGAGTELGWTVHANPAAAVSIGDPTTSGCNIAFSTCQTGSSSPPVLLYSIDVVPLGGAAPYYELGIEPHANPSNANFPCPLINLCDAPVFTAQCVDTAGMFTLDVGTTSIRTPTDPTPAEGAVEVPINTQLSVANLGQDPGCHAGVPFHILYFGTTQDPPRVADSEFCTPNCYTNPYNPGPLQVANTYYWKLKFCGNDGVCSESDLWSFTTGAPVDVESRGWSQVKSVYR